MLAYSPLKVNIFAQTLHTMAEMKQFGIDLELDDAVAQGHYSNLAIISHSTSEFIIDFATVLPGVQKAPGKHLPHTGIIIRSRHRAYPEFAVVILFRAAILVDHHRADRFKTAGI